MSRQDIHQMRNVNTHILALEGDSEVVVFKGNFQEYEADRYERLGNVEPKRIKFRSLLAA